MKPQLKIKFVLNWNKSVADNREPVVRYEEQHSLIATRGIDILKGGRDAIVETWKSTVNKTQRM